MTAGAWRVGRCYAAAGESSLFTGVDVLPAEMNDKKFDYDLVVIGGGSGGLAAAKRAQEHGAKVALCDFVNPSTQGTTWGLGGTCVNVGCIPKKLMHTAGLHGDAMKNAVRHFGWHTEGVELNDDLEYPAPKMVCDWNVLKQNVEDHIRSINFGYVVQLREKGIKYLNAYAKFVDPHTIECTDKKGKTTTISARRVLIATGGRPTIPDVPGAKEYGITSDDIFRLEKDPGKTLVVGASYVALECAGMLHGIGRDASVLMRSIPLRGFDTQMAELVAGYMEKIGIPFHRQCVPKKIVKNAEGRLDVTWENWDSKQEFTETFDTVLFATGRTPETSKIGCDKAGIQLAKSGHVIVDKYERTSTPHIYAIGDIIKGGLELTPVAIKAGQLLADRLFAKGEQTLDYKTVPTTVFTPLEYGCVGLSEDDAIERYGEKEISVFHTFMTPLEWTVPKANMEQNASYVKVLVEKATDKVVGFHILAPNAGEITQGVGVALKCGLTKAILDSTIGIHPTVAEDLVNLRITKESGEDAKKGGC